MRVYVTGYAIFAVFLIGAGVYVWATRDRSK